MCGTVPFGWVKVHGSFEQLPGVSAAQSHKSGPKSDHDAVRSHVRRPKKIERRREGRDEKNRRTKEEEVKWE